MEGWVVEEEMGGGREGDEKIGEGECLGGDVGMGSREGDGRRRRRR